MSTFRLEAVWKNAAWDASDRCFLCILPFAVTMRVCQLCGTGFGDEMHLVFECAAMADLRGQFPYIFQPHQTMQQFMWQPNLLQVAKFLDAGMKRLQTVDPNEGSNM